MFRSLLLFLATTSFALAETPKPIISEDFESTAVGEIPKGFTKVGAISVADDTAHSGKHSLKIEPAVRGPRRIVKQGPEVTALGGEQWGRLYIKFKLPTPTPVIPEGKKSGIIHSTLVAGKAQSPLANDPIEVRFADNLLGMDGTFRYIYNVQPKQRPEFGTSSKTRFKFPEGWTLIEWHLDHATQSYELYLDGEELKEVAIHKGPGQFAGAEIPADFESLAFGWNNYQPAAGEGFTVWLDDIAVGKTRLGPVPAAK